MNNKVWIYIDHAKGKPLTASWETVSAGRSLAEKMNSKLSAVVIGHNVENIAKEAFAYGVDEVLLADAPAVADYRPELFASLLTANIQAAAPEVVLFPSTIAGRELAAMAAVDLKSGVITDAMALDIKDGGVVATRSAYAGKVLAKVICKAKPQLIVLRGRMFAPPAPEAGKSGELTRLEVKPGDSDSKSQVIEFLPSSTDINLSDANVIVSGGRGLANNPAQPSSDLGEKEAEIWRAQQGFKLISELAGLLHGAVGASRSAVDGGYISYEHQVGQTGKIVSPNLYLACGISGAVQHLAGIRTSKLVIGINQDSDAPIFTVARYGVIGNLYDILPALIAAFQKRQG
ncbi:MAG: electron transfer flavoprotein subunit alpha/FixB family protein [Anaerolineaceae bacterium]|nr:electron transfer flavoprotein subunit alpha/FixB family protein [Anaerolineaceae bacterium]